MQPSRKQEKTFGKNPRNGKLSLARNAIQRMLLEQSSALTAAPELCQVKSRVAAALRLGCGQNATD